MRRTQSGFTIVELLIVIVVIGILAAITIVAYNGIQDRARISSVNSALSQSAKKLKLFQVDNPDTYPAAAGANGLDNLAPLGIVNTSDVSYQYSSSANTYCLTATNGTTSYKISSTSATATVGGCAGHGQGGVAAITNLVRNPKGIGSAGAYSSSGWFAPLGGTTDTANVSFGSRTDWHKFIAPTTGNAIMRQRINLSDLVNGQTYTASVTFANAGSSAFSVQFDFCDQGSIPITVQPGETKRVSTSGSKATYDAVYSFIDVQPTTLGGTDGILVSDAMLVSGTSTYNYADGNSTNWVWNGTAGSSTSTGPAL